MQEWIQILLKRCFFTSIRKIESKAHWITKDYAISDDSDGVVIGVNNLNAMKFYLTWYSLSKRAVVENITIRKRVSAQALAITVYITVYILK